MRAKIIEAIEKTLTEGMLFGDERVQLSELIADSILAALPELAQGGEVYTKNQIYEAIEFGTKLGNTAGFDEGHDSWIENQMDLFIKSINSARPTQVNGWISVDKKLPEPDEEVLICINGSVSRYLCRYSHTSQIWFKQDENYTMLGVTHWQPLPPAPSESTPSAPVKPDVKLNLQEILNDMQDRMKYLESEQAKVDFMDDVEINYRSMELTLAIIAVQQKLIGFLSDLKTNGEVEG